MLPFDGDYRKLSYSFEWFDFDVRCFEKQRLDRIRLAGQQHGLWRRRPRSFEIL